MEGGRLLHESQDQIKRSFIEERKEVEEVEEGRQREYSPRCSIGSSGRSSGGSSGS